MSTSMVSVECFAESGHSLGAAMGQDMFLAAIGNGKMDLWIVYGECTVESDQKDLYSH